MKLWLVIGYPRIGLLIKNAGAVWMTRPRASQRARFRLLSMVVLLSAIVVGFVYPRQSAFAFASGDRVTLLMVEQPGCRFCAKWNADIGPAYEQSVEGKFAPLMRVQRDAKVLQNLKPVVFTPTFIVMSGSNEVGRITGYPGRDYFWSELRDALLPAGFEPAE